MAAEKNPTGKALLTSRPLADSERRAAVRQAATQADSAADLRALLLTLGLDPADGKRPR